MPTSKPRITITLTEGQHNVLSELASLQGVSMSSIVVDLIDTTLPALERLAIVLEHSMQAPQHLLRDIQEAMGTSEDVLWSVGTDARQMAFQEVLEGVDVSALADASAPSSLTSKHSKTARKTARPPTSNRGVRIPLVKSVKSMNKPVPSDFQKMKKS